jgi:RNA polymerase sigma-70 factor (ECF subfamily)
MATSPALAVPASAPPADRDLPLADRLGDAEFAAFYAEVGPRLWSYLFSVTGDRAAADDLTQEAFTRVLASRFRPESEEHLRRYLYRTATNLAHDRGRAARRAPLQLLDEHDAPIAAAPVGLGRDLARAWSALRPKERRLLWLAHVEELDHRAIAEALGARAGSVRVMLFRARRRLAVLLGREEPGRKESA